MTAPELAGRVALVTGGGGGLGAALCTTLAEAGATVVVGDVRGAAAEVVAAGLRAAGGKGVGLALDVTDVRHAGEVVYEVVATHGALDVLVNNAGTDLTVPFEALDPEDWDRIVAVNLRGPFVMSRHAFPLMRARGRGTDLEALTLASDDRSVVVHSCHGRMREVEALHDELMASFEADPTLETRDVIVMAPDIDAYAPYIDAVFGTVALGRMAHSWINSAKSWSTTGS